MKKLFAALLALCLLAGCTVGPKEELPAPESDVSVTEPDIQDGEILSDPITDESAGQDTPAPEEPVGEYDVAEPVEPEETEPAEPDEICSLPLSESDQAVDTAPEPPNGEDISYFDEPLTLYSTISLNVRSGPSTDYDRIGSLKEGQSAAAVGELDGWYLIEYKDGYGYVSGSYMTDEEPIEAEEIDYPELSIPETSVINTIINDYAASKGVSAESVSISEYYGGYGAGQAVLMLSTEFAYTDDINEFEVAGYDFELASGGYKIELHTEEGGFVDIKDAYERGIISKEDVAAIHHYRKSSLKDLHLAGISAGSSASDSEIIRAYLKTLPGDIGITAADCFIAARYGETANGPVVLLGCSAMSYTEALTTVSVGNYTFHFRNGNNRISLYYNGGLIFLPDAYDRGLVTDEELSALILNDDSTGFAGIGDFDVR